MASLKWVSYSGGAAPENLAPAGLRWGETTFVSRGMIGEELAVGKFLDGHAYLPSDGKETSTTSCELLVCDKPEELLWLPASNGDVPNGAIQAGYSHLGYKYYVGRATHGGVVIPGKVYPEHNCIYVGTDWKEHSKSDYEVLVAKSYVLPTEN